MFVVNASDCEMKETSGFFFSACDHLFLLRHISVDTDSEQTDNNTGIKSELNKDKLPLDV